MHGSSRFELSHNRSIFQGNTREGRSIWLENIISHRHWNKGSPRRKLSLCPSSWTYLHVDAFILSFLLFSFSCFFLTCFLFIRQYNLVLSCIPEDPQRFSSFCCLNEGPHPNSFKQKWSEGRRAPKSRLGEPVGWGSTYIFMSMSPNVWSADTDTAITDTVLIILL